LNVGTNISLVSAILQLAFAVTFLVLARAPGWRRARVYALLAFAAGSYSAVDIAFTVGDLDVETLQRFSALNYLLAGVNCALWLGFAYSHPHQRWRELPRWVRALMAVTVGLGAIGQIPGLLDTDQIRIVDLPSIGTRYQQSTVTGFASVVGTWFLVVLLLVVVRFARALRRGKADAGAPLIGFSVFFGCAVVEVLVTNEVFDFIYPADLGFLAVVIAMLAETLRNLVTDANRLDELAGRLAATVENRTKERDVARDALTHAERLAAVGQLAAGAGHEINNPLSVVRGGLELLRDDPDTSERAEIIADSIEAADRIARVIADLRSYALPDADQHELVDLASVLGSALKLASHQLRHVATVVEELAARGQVRANPTRLSQVFVNLLVNAGQAFEGHLQAAPRITIRTRLAPGARIEIEVSDNGRGVAPEALARLGEPYFSTRLQRGGTGLGLFMARGILATLDGTLTYTSTVGQGTTALIGLPAVTAEPIRVLTTPPPVVHVPRPVSLAEVKLRILVVDDEPAVASAIARTLRGADLTIAHGGDDALARIDEHPDFDVIVCDLMMPRGSGIDVHAGLVASHPALVSRIVFLTGGAVTDAARRFLAQPGVRHLDKPFDRRSLVATVTELAASSPSVRPSAPGDRRTARRPERDTPSASRPAR